MILTVPEPLQAAFRPASCPTAVQCQITVREQDKNEKCRLFCFVRSFFSSCLPIPHHKPHRLTMPVPLYRPLLTYELPMALLRRQCPTRWRTSVLRLCLCQTKWLPSSACGTALRLRDFGESLAVLLASLVRLRFAFSSSL